MLILVFGFSPLRSLSRFCAVGRVWFRYEKINKCGKQARERERERKKSDFYEFHRREAETDGA